jgi:tetratricopeptide (TPR) repeat protein
MKRTLIVICIALVFSLGIATGVVAAKKLKTIDPETYKGKEPEEAARALLELARVRAGDGTWGRIHVARVYYRMGEKEEGEKILDEVLKEEAKAGEWMRIGRLYYHAGQWDAAKKTFDTVLTLKPDDEDWLAEIGAYYNLQGDREKAEEMFEKSFSTGLPLKNILAAAGSYVDVPPRQR